MSEDFTELRVTEEVKNCPRCGGNVEWEFDCPGYGRQGETIWVCQPPCGNTVVLYCVGTNGEDEEDGCTWWWSEEWRRGNRFVSLEHRSVPMGEAPEKEE